MQLLKPVHFHPSGDLDGIFLEKGVVRFVCTLTSACLSVHTLRDVDSTRSLMLHIAPCEAYYWHAAKQCFPWSKASLHDKAHVHVNTGRLFASNQQGEGRKQHAQTAWHCHFFVMWHANIDAQS